MVIRCQYSSIIMKINVTWIWSYVYLFYSWCAGFYIVIIIGVILLVISAGFDIGGGILYQAKSSGSRESAKEFIAYQGDTLYLAEVNELNSQVTVQQLCSGGGDHTVELYLAPNCDLQPHCFSISSGVTTVNSTKSPTIMEVHFSGQSHIYMTSSSNITFTVEISTPMANTSLVIFDNYTYFTDFEHSDHPSTNNALLVHMFKGQRSSYTFQEEMNTYFAAFESLSNINFTFRYSGYVCNYSHLDYKKSECDLPASSCQQKNCPFEYQPHNKTCILGYVPPSVTHPTFAYLSVEILQKVTAFKQRTAGITLLSLFSVLIVVSVVCVIVVVVIKLIRRPPRGYERLNNN